MCAGAVDTLVAKRRDTATKIKADGSTKLFIFQSPFYLPSLSLHSCLLFPASSVFALSFPLLFSLLSESELIHVGPQTHLTSSSYISLLITSLPPSGFSFTVFWAAILHSKKFSRNLKCTKTEDVIRNKTEECNLEEIRTAEVA